MTAMTAAALAAVKQNSKQQHQQMNRRKPLLRAHSCGSLMGLKEKALLSRNLPLDIWELLRADVRAKAGLDNDRTAAAAAVAAAAGGPLTMLHLQNTAGSRCCNL